MDDYPPGSYGYEFEKAKRELHTAMLDVVNELMKTWFGRQLVKLFDLEGVLN